MICRALLLPCTLLLFACGKPPQAEAPPPDTLTRAASGYYCLMTVVDHKGPKGQLFLSDRPQPLWFTSVRDTIAFTMSPEEPKNIAAIYVNDMAGADWDDPGRDNWIDAREAWYVIESGRTGGMGAPEAVPFSTKAHAAAFAEQHGGRVVDFDSIPAEYIQQTAS